MRNFIFGFFLSLTLGSTFGHAAANPMVKVSGTVVSFDEKVIRIMNKGQVSLAPRASGPKVIRPGQDIEVTYNLEEFKKTLGDSKKSVGSDN